MHKLLSTTLLVCIGLVGFAQHYSLPAGMHINAITHKMDSLKNLFTGINYLIQKNPANRILLRNTAARETSANDILCGYLCGGIILPVTGLQLQGLRLSETQVQLDWKTLSETNSSGFVIERSFGTGDNFQRCGWLQSVGNSTSERKYKTLDANSYTGTTYYRLQQQDKDGKTTYSNVVAVKGYTTVASVTISPNPSTQAATQILLQGFRVNEPVNLIVTDVGGRIVASQKFTPVGVQFIVPFASLPTLVSGFYNVVASNASQKATASCVLIP